MKKIRFFMMSVLVTSIFSGCKSTDVTQPYFHENQVNTEIITVKNGQLRGIVNEDGTVELFAGIPFAKPPVGDLRWREPEDAEDWEGVFEADHFAPMAMQNRNSKFVQNLFNAYIHSEGDRTDFGPMSEDCLYLNVWRPAPSSSASSEEKIPVLVYVHGGSLTSGSSWFQSYDGEALAKKGIIVVTVAYRVGIFGYYAHPDLMIEGPNYTTGNYGLLDQIKALKWVNDNIGAFGGDASNITIAGESAGSSSINALCASPLTKGLFRRAIGESSSLVVPVPPHTFRTQQAACIMGQKIMDEFGKTTIEEMRAIPAEELLKTNHANNAMTVDGYAMPEYPWYIYARNENHEEALLNGFNLEEGRAFTMLSKINRKNYRALLDESPYVPDDKLDALCNLRPVKNDKEAKQFYSDAFSAICFTYPHYSWTKVVTAQNKPVWEYVFTKENKCISTMHSGEMVYCYGNLDGNKNYDESDYALQEIMTTYWVNFVKYGNPNGEDFEKPKALAYGGNLPEWETSAESDGKVLELGLNVHMVSDPFTEFYEYLDFDIDPEKRPVTYGKKEE